MTKAQDVISGESSAERTVRLGLLQRHPDWTIALNTTDHGRWWVIRDRLGFLKGNHRDIVIAGQVAEGRRRL